jgi:hypothetical protein
MKTMNNDAILRKAHELVNAERQDDYGSPAASLTRIVAMWTAYLEQPVNARDVALLLALMKIAREAHRCKEDNLIDAAGYIGLAADMAALEVFHADSD